MEEPVRTQWQVCCAFNGFCKQTLKNEAINAYRDMKRHQQHEVTFSDLSKYEENQLCIYDNYFTDDKNEQTFFIAGREITAKLLTEAMNSLPKERCNIVILYYFMDMSDAEIAKLYNIPRSTVQYRRTSSFELLRHYLEEYAYVGKREKKGKE